MAEYNVILKDAAGYDISTDLEYGLAAAKWRARLFLTDVYADTIGTTHTALGTYKVEVQDTKGVCVWDAFRVEG
jgi:hypothetical protein